MTYKTRISRPKCLAGLVILLFLCLMIYGIIFVTETDVLGVKASDVNSNTGSELPRALKFKPISYARDETMTNLKSSTASSSVADALNDGHKQDSTERDQAAIESEVKYPTPNYDVHLFYYPWYGSPAIDGKYLHWNHRYLRHWVPKEAAKWPDGQHNPPDDIGSNFYPRLGPYSSRDPLVLENHMQQIRSTGAGVLVVSWYPVGSSDDQGEELDFLLPAILDHADKYSLKVCLHIEPYKNRSHRNLRDNIKYIVNKYGNHAAFYRKLLPSGRNLPLYYIYDSYLMADEEWKMILRPEGELTVRNTELDGVFLGLLVEKRHTLSLVSSGFDGFYTYFASNGFTFGSNVGNWNFLSRFAKERNILFIPSVGPGYIDESVRPWNSANTKDRKNGDYYERTFEAAVNAAPSAISITSFNEWHEGTQIEEAIPKVIEGFKYLDYTPNHPQYYLMLTRKWVFKFRRRRAITDNKAAVA